MLFKISSKLLLSSSSPGVSRVWKGRADVSGFRWRPIACQYLKNGMEWSNVAYETQAIYFSHRYILNSQGWIILQISFMENKIGERNPNNLKSGTTTLYFLEESKYYTIKQICEDSLHIPHFLAKQQMHPTIEKSKSLQAQHFNSKASATWPQEFHRSS